MADRLLGWHLGLGDLQCRPVCHGFANACPCADCQDRAKHQPSSPAKQPWELAA